MVPVLTTTADPLSAGFITMSSRLWRLYNALRLDLLRLPCFGLRGMCDLTADSTRFTNASRSRPCLWGCQSLFGMKSGYFYHGQQNET